MGNETELPSGPDDIIRYLIEKEDYVAAMDMAAGIVQSLIDEGDDKRAFNYLTGMEVKVARNGGKPTAKFQEVKRKLHQMSKCDCINRARKYLADSNEDGSENNKKDGRLALSILHDAESYARQSGTPLPRDYAELKQKAYALCVEKYLKEVVDALTGEQKNITNAQIALSRLEDHAKSSGKNYECINRLRELIT